MMMTTGVKVIPDALALALAGIIKVLMEKLNRNIS
jgi:hypothetical protein